MELTSNVCQSNIFRSGNTSPPTVVRPRCLYVRMRTCCVYVACCLCVSRRPLHGPLRFVPLSPQSVILESHLPGPFQRRRRQASPAFRFDSLLSGFSPAYVSYVYTLTDFYECPTDSSTFVRFIPSGVYPEASKLCSQTFRLASRAHRTTHVRTCIKPCTRMVKTCCWVGFSTNLIPGAFTHASVRIRPSGTTR